MNLMQTKLQQTFKEYIDLKNYIQEDNKNLEEQKKKAHNEAVLLDELDDQSGYFFEKIGYKDLLRIDFEEAKKKLYYLILAYNDLVEIPVEIKEEIQDYKPKSVFTIIDGKKEIIDKELYETYKKQHQDYARNLVEYQRVIENNNGEA